MGELLGKKLDGAVKSKKLNEKARKEIERWLEDEELKEFAPVLAEKIKGEKWEDLMDSFYRMMIFATAGIRGVMDVGTNRINSYTIRLASQAYSQYILKRKKDIAQRGVAIAYDSRLNSETFMKETARVLAANGIPVNVFKYYRATPELSFAVRYLGLAGGIVITASHNPPEYNGYKVYDEKGVQVLPDAGALIEKEFIAIKKINMIPFDEAVNTGLIKYIGDEVDKAFAESAKKVSVYPSRSARVVFSPLHGVGSQSVLPVLKELGFNDIRVVESQMELNGNFPNVAGHFPNPEFAVVYDEAIKLANKTNADIALVSDPDADRLGIAVHDKRGEPARAPRAGGWRNLTGNQAAVLMGYFYLIALKDARKLPKNPVVIKTSVTTELVRDVAESFGAEVIGDLLVGFKFIGDRIEGLPKNKSFIFGCEESVGYLFGDNYRDKGAETPAVVACEMASWCKDNKTTPVELLESIYKKYGYYAERLYYETIEGVGAFERMNLAMKSMRSRLPKEIGGRRIIKIMDRLNGEVIDGAIGNLIEKRDWDRGDMISFFLTDDERNAVHIRPSGTEPKIKIYTAIKGDLAKKAKQEIDAEAEKIEKDMVKIFKGILTGVNVDVF